MQGKLMAGARRKAEMMKPFTANNPYQRIRDSCGITLCVDSVYDVHCPIPWSMKVTRLTPSVRKTLKSFYLNPDFEMQHVPKGLH